MDLTSLTKGELEQLLRKETRVRQGAMRFLLKIRSLHPIRRQHPMAIKKSREAKERILLATRNISNMRRILRSRKSSRVR